MNSSKHLVSLLKNSRENLDPVRPYNEQPEVHVISMPSENISQPFYRKTISKLSQFGYNFHHFDAVNGKDLKIDGVRDYLKSEFGIKLPNDGTKRLKKDEGYWKEWTLGELAVMASHFKVWKEMGLKNNENRRVISLEADTMPLKPWDLDNSIFDDYDLVFLQTNPHANYPWYKNVFPDSNPIPYENVYDPSSGELKYKGYYELNNYHIDNGRHIEHSITTTWPIDDMTGFGAILCVNPKKVIDFIEGHEFHTSVDTHFVVYMDKSKETEHWQLSDDERNQIKVGFLKNSIFYQSNEHFSLCQEENKIRTDN